MGDSITIDWIDGPTPSEVRSLVAKYQAGSFDGSSDSYDYEINEFKKAHGSTRQSVQVLLRWLVRIAVKLPADTPKGVLGGFARRMVRREA